MKIENMIKVGDRNSRALYQVSASAVFFAPGSSFRNELNFDISLSLYSAYLSTDLSNSFDLAADASRATLGSTPPTVAFSSASAR